MLRLTLVRRALAAVLIPLLMLAGFGGTTLVAHAHDQRDTHFHVLLPKSEAGASDVEHRLAHGTEAARCTHRGSDDLKPGPCHECLVLAQGSVNPASCEGSREFVISIPDHEQSLARGVGITAAIKAVQLVRSAIAVIWKQPECFEQAGSPGGRELGGPGSLCALAACERLVRTSRALLL